MLFLCWHPGPLTYECPRRPRLLKKKTAQFKSSKGFCDSWSRGKHLFGGVCRWCFKKNERRPHGCTIPVIAQSHTGEGGNFDLAAPTDPSAGSYENARILGPNTNLKIGTRDILTPGTSAVLGKTLAGVTLVRSGIAPC